MNAGSQADPVRAALDALSRRSDFVQKDGIWRHRSAHSQTQAQTADTFGFKWAQRPTYESPAMTAMSRDWLRERYRLPDRSIEQIAAGKSCLDVGCGAAYSAMILFDGLLSGMRYLGIDVSTSVDVAKARFAERGLPGEFVQCSLDDFPDEIGGFDLVFSEGVLHHTDSTRESIRRAARHLAPGGLFMFYVYRRKGPIREFTDDHVRAAIAGLGNEEAWEKLMPLTKLGKALGEMNVEIDVPEAVDVLGIPAGKMPLQRFFYWHVFKAFHRADLSLDEMNHINFDWYRPANCHRHTADEIQAWCAENGLAVLALREEPSGLTAIAEAPRR